MSKLSKQELIAELLAEADREDKRATLAKTKASRSYHDGIAIGLCRAADIVETRLEEV